MRPKLCNACSTTLRHSGGLLSRCEPIHAVDHEGCMPAASAGSQPVGDLLIWPLSLAHAASQQNKCMSAPSLGFDVVSMPSSQRYLLLSYPHEHPSLSGQSATGRQVWVPSRQQDSIVPGLYKAVSHAINVSG